MLLAVISEEMTIRELIPLVSACNNKRWAIIAVQVRARTG